MILRLIIWYFVINTSIWFVAYAEYNQQNKTFPAKIKTLTFFFGLPIVIYEAIQWMILRKKI